MMSQLYIHLTYVYLKSSIFLPPNFHTVNYGFEASHLFHNNYMETFQIVDSFYEAYLYINYQPIYLQKTPQIYQHYSSKNLQLVY